MYLIQGRTVSTDTLLQVRDLRQSGILTTCPQQIAQRLDRDLSGTALIEEREGFLVVG